jgi:rare lipoprotein A
MLARKIVKPGGQATCSRTALAVVAAALLVGGTATEASAKSRHHQHQAYHHHHNHHVARANSNHRAASTSEAASSSNSASSNSSSSNSASSNSSWRDANATAGRSFSGVASFYGNESGSKTASGQRFDQNAMTCAHRSLPFGTKLRVSTGRRSVVVTVNDRGPFIRGRVLDLSKGAARVLGMDGIAHVTAEVIS